MTSDFPDIDVLPGKLTRIHSQILDLDLDFMDLAGQFSHVPGTVVLASGGVLDCSRYHMLGVLPRLTLEARRGKVSLSTEDRTTTLQQGPFEVLRLLLEHFCLPDQGSDTPLVAGLMGYLAYDMKDYIERLPRTSVDDLQLPAMLLYLPSCIVVHDKSSDLSRILMPEFSGISQDTEHLLAKFHKIATSPVTGQAAWKACAEDLQANFSRPDYQAAVQRIIDYIAAGDVYQVNLSQRFETSFDGDGFTLFRHLFESNPAPFFAYIQASDHQIVSTSPERFLLRNCRRVETRPIKGTRPRMSDSAEDEEMRQDLTTSAKDDAELSMIVDLLRNDIGKVCRAGSVRVAEHKRVEAYENVYHLVSMVEGELDEGMDSVDLIKAAFPGGSITGAPKVRAMEIIDELETCRRHVYCGSIGYISFHDTMDLSIAIRTATVVGDTLCYSVGGGIVFDSDPEAEYEETLHKGRTLMAACGKIEQRDPDPVAWFNGRLMRVRSASVPVGDLGLQYGFGFFETIRTDNGKAPLLRHHAARFEKTWKALMPSPHPDLTWAAIVERVLIANNLQKGCGTVKILTTRGSRTAPPWDYNLLVTARPYKHRLTEIKKQGLTLGSYPHPRQTPLAAHKTLNYLYYHQAGQWARQHGFDEALILNPDGSVSETNSANLLVVNDRRVTRPESPAVLPGIMTQAVCHQLVAWDYHVAQRPVQPADLLFADQVLATNALMGAVPIIAVDSRNRPAGDDLWQRLNDAIIPGWR
jgi:para-aminobenzoate synthetase component 1